MITGTRVRTKNIQPMFVTLDVSRLSGWSNADAFCRVVGGDWKYSGHWAQGTREAHPKHAVHVRDAGRVETQRLVERRRRLPSRDRCYETEPGAGKEIGGGRGVTAAQLVCKGPNWTCVGAWHAQAHIKHSGHACDFRRVETQRLVERRRRLPSRDRCYETEPGAGKEIGGGRGVTAAQLVCKGPNWTCVGAWHAQAHIKHSGHACDFRRVETQRLVERQRGLRCRGEGLGIQRPLGAGHARGAPETCRSCS